MQQPVNADCAEYLRVIDAAWPESQGSEFRQSSDGLRITKTGQAVDGQATNSVQVIQHGRIELLLEMIVEADFQSIPKRSTGSLDPAEINGSAHDFIDDLDSVLFKMPNWNVLRNRPMNLQYLVRDLPLRGDKRTRVWHDLK